MCASRQRYVRSSRRTVYQGCRLKCICDTTSLLLYSTSEASSSRMTGPPLPPPTLGEGAPGDGLFMRFLPSSGSFLMSSSNTCSGSVRCSTLSSSVGWPHTTTAFARCSTPFSISPCSKYDSPICTSCRKNRCTACWSLKSGNADLAARAALSCSRASIRLLRRFDLKFGSLRRFRSKYRQYPTKHRPAMPAAAALIAVFDTSVCKQRDTNQNRNKISFNCSFIFLNYSNGLMRVKNTTLKLRTSIIIRYTYYYLSITIDLSI